MKRRPCDECAVAGFATACRSWDEHGDDAPCPAFAGPRPKSRPRLWRDLLDAVLVSALICLPSALLLAAVYL